MLTLYPFDDSKTPFSMEYALYRLNKTKIVFENYYPNNAKLLQLSKILYHDTFC